MTVKKEKKEKIIIDINTVPELLAIKSLIKEETLAIIDDENGKIDYAEAELIAKEIIKLMIDGWPTPNV
mgnify:FL=1|tara:strand:- start:432 stop:638 length:207 start_codon:yes stop_codon:yes gene_type:complete